MKQYYLLFFCGFATLFGSCKSTTGSDPLSQSPETASIDQFFPVAYGDYWIYDSQSFDSTGLNPRVTRTVEIIDSQMNLGHESFTVSDNGNNPYSAYYFSGTGVYGIPNLVVKPAISSSYLVLRSPMSIGEKLVLMDTMIEDVRLKRELIFKGNGESVTVPAGTFSCCRYESTLLYASPAYIDTAEIAESYYAPEVGLVEVKRYDKTGIVLTSIDQLTSYRVNGN